MDDYISRQAAIDALNEVSEHYTEKGREWHPHVNFMIDAINELPSAQPDNQVHLCDSCKHTYPDCPSQNDDVIFGNGNGDDNICACAKYAPSTQPDGISLEWIDKHLEWLDNCDNDFAQLAKVGIRAMVDLWKKDRT